MLAGWLTTGMAPQSLAAGYTPAAPTREVSFVRVEWKDPARNRTVPAKIYYPVSGAGAAPVIVFSHGLGGSREGYEYLGLHWAGCGYVSVHLQHHGSDDAVWKDEPLAQRMAAMRRAAASVQNSVDRPKDVSFALDQLAVMNHGDKVLRGRLDLSRVGVSGHSYGGYTTLAIAGQQFLQNGNGPEFRDPRVKAAISMSAPVPRQSRANADAYAGIRIPVFHLTGTKDESPLNTTTAAERRIPFDRMRGETCFLNFTDGDHMVFSGARRLSRKARELDEVFHRHITRGTTAFWDAHLTGDRAAWEWLMQGGLAKELGAAGVFEVKAAR